MITKSFVEIYSPDGDRRGLFVDVDESTVTTLLQSLRDEWSATVRLKGESQELAVSISSGRAALLLATGEDEFYDFVGDSSATGWTEFVHGGQPAEHPARHVASIADAQSVTMEFLKLERLSLDGNRWELQKESQSE